jgi:hypothetical protein
MMNESGRRKKMKAPKQRGAFPVEGHEPQLDETGDEEE